MRFIRLSLFAVIVVGLLAGSLWILRVPLLRAAGINFDAGSPGPTALDLAPDIRADVFASGLVRPRFMAESPDGTIFVADPGADRVVALPDRDGDGVADELVVVGEDYDAAHSIAFRDDGSLLVAGSGSLFEVALDDDLREIGRRTVSTYPSGGSHSTRTVVVTPDSSLLLSVGSTCNVCEEGDERRATVLSIPAEGGTGRVLMRGLRNAVGLAVDPETGTAWATNNGRDMMGDDVPPETLYRVVEGADAGWPRCHAGDIVDPEFGDDPDPETGSVGCDGVVAPSAIFQAHAAPLGLAFWRDHAVIAFHGSWNCSQKVGYEVLWLPWHDGPAGPAEALAGGFLDATTGDASGRPAGVLSASDGALFVSDDKAGLIYRITAP